MTIFNELKNDGNYPTLKVCYEDTTKETEIQNVQFYTVYEINGEERMKVYTRDGEEPIELENIDYVYNKR